MEYIELFQLSSLEKVFLDFTLPEKELTELSGLKNERLSYQIAYTGKVNYMRKNMKITVNSPIKESVSIRKVGNVPSEYPIRVVSDEHYERYSPGLFPDVLYPMESDTIEVLCGTWHSLWITIDLNSKFPAGNYPVEIILSDDEVKVSRTMTVKVIDAELPQQDMIFTQWFHADCLADYYGVEVFSEKHWEIVEKFIKTASLNGINMMLTPIFTPPLDTQVGHERTTVQLIEIEKNGKNYIFNFDKLGRWIKLCRKNGIRYFEIAHLFTQWGLEATPKIIATEDGEEKRIFGWDVSSEDSSYENFLSQMLPALDRFLKGEGVNENTFFHISDEPSGNHIDKYLKLKNVVKKYLPDYRIIDALSDFEFYKKGVVEHPIPATNHIQPFIDNNVSDLWCYYCCSQAVKVSNRFMAMPSYRNIVIGLQFYKYDIRGFLHWGYNFYNSALSLKKINPFMVTDAINTYQSGDAFSVYPGEDGPIESLRLAVFYDALQDLRALKLLESFIGKDDVVSFIEEEAGMLIRFDQYPHDKEFLINLRKKINAKINSFV